MIPVALALALASHPASPLPSAERIAVERCVWDRVRAELDAAPRVANIDTQLVIADAAVAKCRKSIRRWAKVSSAVQEAGDPLQQVEQAMTNHYLARAALFAAGATRPFHLTDANAPNR